MTIGPSEFKTVVLVLSPPSRFIRRVDFQGKLFINDDDFRPRECDDGDDCGEFPISVTLEVRPDRPTATHSLQRCVDDEVNVELRFFVGLSSDQTTVFVTVYEGLYEYTECTTDVDEFGGAAAFAENLPEGATRTFTLTARNDREKEPETRGELTLTVVNQQAP